MAGPKLPPILRYGMSCNSWLFFVSSVSNEVTAWRFTDELYKMLNTSQSGMVKTIVTWKKGCVLPSVKNASILQHPPEIAPNSMAVHGNGLLYVLLKKLNELPNDSATISPVSSLNNHALCRAHYTAAHCNHGKIWRDVRCGFYAVRDP